MNSTNIGDTILSLLEKNYGDKNFNVSDVTVDPINFVQTILIYRLGKYYKLDVEKVRDEIVLEQLSILKDYDISKHITEIEYESNKSFIRKLFHVFKYDGKEIVSYTKEEIERMGFQYEDKPSFIDNGQIYIARSRKFDSTIDFYDFMDSHYTKKLCGLMVGGIYQIVARIPYKKEELENEKV